ERCECEHVRRRNERHDTYMGETKNRVLSMGGPTFTPTSLSSPNRMDLKELKMGQTDKYPPTKVYVGRKLHEQQGICSTIKDDEECE
ncbi:unnamed protein product, partial [Sphenostylis stenocarpa]